MRRAVDPGLRALHIIYHSTSPLQPLSQRCARGAHRILRNTSETRAAAGLSQPPPTLATGTKSPTQRPSDQCVPGCQAAVEAAAHSSIFCAKNRPSEPRLSRLKRQRSPIAQVIDLRREIQTVNARMPNGRSARTARLGNMGAWAGSPGGAGTSGGSRQTSARQSQTSGIMCKSGDAGASARAPA